MGGKVTNISGLPSAEQTQTGMSVVTSGPLPPAVTQHIEPLVNTVAALVEKLEAGKDGGGNGGGKKSWSSWVTIILTILLSLGGSWLVTETHEPEPAPVPMPTPAPAVVKEDLAEILKRLESIETAMGQRDRDQDYMIEILGAAVVASFQGPDEPDEVGHLRYELKRKKEVAE